MRSKEILVFRYRKGLRIGSLEEPHEDKLRVATKKGRAFSIPRENVLLACGVNAGTQGELDAFKEKVESLVESMDLREVWELAAADTQPLAPREIAELYWDDLSDTSRHAATIWHLHSGSCPYFEPRGDRFVPRDSAVVEEHFRRLEARRREEAEDAALLAWLDGQAPGPRPEEMSPRQRMWYERLRSWVVHGDEWSLASQTRAFFAEILGGKGNLRRAAFDLLARRGVFSSDENLDLLRLEVPLEFPPEAEAHAAELGRPVAPAEPDGERRDLRDLAVFSIDDVKTTDIDDALSLTPTEGGYRLGIHVTDLSAIAPGSPLDEAGRQRVSSIYLPERRIHMLPPAFAEGAGGLLEGEERAAISLLVDLDESLAPLRTELVSSRIASRHRLSYDEANAVLAGAPHPLARGLGVLTRVAAACAARRVAAGALLIDRPELEIWIEPSGELRVEVREKETPAHQIVSELMVLYNVEAARFCRERGIPVIYRTQDRVPAVEVPASAHPAYRLHLLLKATPPPNLSLEPGPHRMLGVEPYSQFTSPLRRYGDLVMQRQLAGCLRRGEAAHPAAEISRVLYETEERTRELRRLEGARERYWMLRHLESFLGETFEAVVLEPYERQATVELLKYPFRASAALGRRVAPGEVLALRLAHIDTWEGAIRLVEA